MEGWAVFTLNSLIKHLDHSYSSWQFHTQENSCCSWCWMWKKLWKCYFLFSCLSSSSLSVLKANSQQSDLLRQTSYNWFVTLGESQVHFSQICVFLNTDFGRSGSGRDFGREKLLGYKNRTELLTPPAVLSFLCSGFYFLHHSFCFGKETCKAIWREKKIKPYFWFRHKVTILNRPQTSSVAQLIHLLAA